jgi:hypothetical protein
VKTVYLVVLKTEGLYTLKNYKMSCEYDRNVQFFAFYFGDAANPCIFFSQCIGRNSLLGKLCKILRAEKEFLEISGQLGNDRY